jgi:predicted signal transduction protein with EAL and GGDEF domain
LTGMLIILLLVWLLQEKRHNRNLVLAHKDTENAVVAQSLMQSFAYPFKVYEQIFILGCRIGISLFPANGQDAETLLKQAD